MAEGKRGIIARGLAFVGLLGGLLTATGHVKEGWVLFQRALITVPLPYHHLYLREEKARKAQAARLLAAMHLNEICVFQALAADLSESGWNADLVVIFAPRVSGEECDESGAQRYVAAFVPDGFSLRHAGTEGGPDTTDRPSSFEVAGRFVLQRSFGTDWPFIEVWYGHSGALRHGGGVQITLTDAAENEYELRTRPIPGGLLAWGTPDGLFHLLVAEDGSLTHVPGLPPTVARRDVLAVSLHWDGETFRVPLREARGHSWRPMEREQWPEFGALDKEGGTVKVLRLGPLDRLYVSGCEASQGFVKAEEMLPGALMPRFSETPILRCGGRGEEGQAFDIRVEQLQP